LQKAQLPAFGELKLETTEIVVVSPIIADATGADGNDGDEENEDDEDDDDDVDVDFDVIVMSVTRPATAGAPAADDTVTDCGWTDQTSLGTLLAASSAVTSSLRELLG